MKFLSPGVKFLGQNAPSSISAGALSQTLVGSLQRSPELLAGFKGSLLRRGIGGERKGREEKGARKGKGREGKGGKDGEGAVEPTTYSSQVHYATLVNKNNWMFTDPTSHTVPTSDHIKQQFTLSVCRNVCVRYDLHCLTVPQRVQ